MNKEPALFPRSSTATLLVASDRYHRFSQEACWIDKSDAMLNPDLDKHQCRRGSDRWQITSGRPAKNLSLPGAAMSCSVGHST